ncbi:MAG: patatin-like phospholipase family protein [Sulfobacillus sp.]
MTTALVMCPGGTRGLGFHCGVLSVLFNNPEFRGFDGFAGNSAGAFISGFLSKYPKGTEYLALQPLVNLIEQVIENDIWSDPFPPQKLTDFRAYNFLKKTRFTNPNLNDGREVSVGAVDVMSNEYKLFDLNRIKPTDERYLGAILSSSTMIDVMYAKKFDDMVLIDGGYHEKIPVENLRKKYDTYIVLNSINRREMYEISRDPLLNAWRKQWIEAYDRFEVFKRNKPNSKFVHIDAVRPIYGDILSTDINDFYVNYDIGVQSVVTRSNWF